MNKDDVFGIEDKWHHSNIPEFFTRIHLQEEIPDRHNGGTLGTLSVTYTGGLGHKFAGYIEITGEAQKIADLKSYLRTELPNINMFMNDRTTKADALANAEPDKPEGVEYQTRHKKFALLKTDDTVKLKIKLGHGDLLESCELADALSVLHDKMGFPSTKLLKDFDQCQLIHNTHINLRDYLISAQEVARLPKDLEERARKQINELYPYNDQDSVERKEKMFKRFLKENTPEKRKQRLNETFANISGMAEIAMKGYYAEPDDITNAMFERLPPKPIEGLPLPGTNEVQYIRDLRDEIGRIYAQDLGLVFAAPNDNPTSWQDREKLRKDKVTETDLPDF